MLPGTNLHLDIDVGVLLPLQGWQLLLLHSPYLHVPWLGSSRLLKQSKFVESERTNGIPPATIALHRPSANLRTLVVCGGLRRPKRRCRALLRTKVAGERPLESKANASAASHYGNKCEVLCEKENLFTVFGDIRVASKGC